MLSRRDTKISIFDSLKRQYLDTGDVTAVHAESLALKYGQRLRRIVSLLEEMAKQGVLTPTTGGEYHLSRDTVRLLLGEIASKTARPLVWHVYGDESTKSDISIYGLVLVNQHSLDALLGSFCKLKVNYGASSDDELHCRTLFNNYARNKTDWRHLDRNEIFRMIGDIAFLLKRYFVQVCIGAIAKDEYPPSLPAEEDIVELQLDDKHFAFLSYQAAMLPIRQVFKPEELNLHLDRDTTNVQNFFGGRIQAQRLYDSTWYMDGNEHDVRPQPSDAFQGFLEIADLVAYVAANALTNISDDRKAKFQMIYKLLDPIFSTSVYEPENVKQSRLEELHNHILKV